MRRYFVPFVLIASACSRAQSGSEADSGPAAAVDHIPKGDLAPGNEKAFALPLPYNMRVVRRFDRSLIAEGEPSPELLASYVRTRVKDGRSLEGPASTRFENVRVPDEPERLLTITVDRDNAGTTRLTVDDVTPMREEKLPQSPADRMKAAGLTPDGKIADPKRFE